MPCENCHTFSSWTPLRKFLEFDHNSTPFPLRGRHQGVNCQQCHTKLVFSNTGTRCADCHADIHRRQMGADCERCHSVKGWQEVRNQQQHQNRFPLLGAHALQECDACHKGAATGQFAGLSTDCISCHAVNYAQTTVPNHRTSNFPTACQTCHTMDGWPGAKFDHAGIARFALTGAHARLDCSACHGRGNYAGLSTACATCHINNYNNTQNPNHRTAGLPQTCDQCHTTAGWNPANMDHSLTRFALTGAHVSVACTQCHSNGQYTGTSSACASCHLPNYQKTTNPNHVSAGFPQDCSVCHTTTQWAGAKFDHSRTQFPLVGAHVSQACSSCHSSGVYAGLSTACVSCHLSNYNNATNPNHRTSAFPQTCDMCHTPVGWSPATLDHSRTGFALTGAHTSLQCAQCHINGVYAGTSPACASCHINKYNATTNPNHGAAGFPTDCSVCHSTASFSGATFTHTGFVLTGAHTSLQCSQCHSDGVYAGKSKACASCHLAQYNAQTDPNHRAAGFPTDCSLCHSTTTFANATFAHTTFPLTGVHATLQCSTCHSDGVYAGKSKACNSCHLANYNSTTNPNHRAAGFPTDCSVCHSTSSWAGATFNHSTTAFPLTGAHVSQSCTACHASGVYAGLSTACVSCHLSNYNGTTNPNHVHGGFPQTCNTCHTTIAWVPSTFNHSTTAFPLTGRHTSVACANCHIGGRYAGTPTACYSCHKTDYDSVSNPNHIAAGFPTTCTTCHTTSGWTGATFNHTWFPIYSGTHAGRWHTCGDCHTNASNYAVFSCTGCHSKTSTDSHHSGVQNYVYNSTSCYSCHPRGSAG